SIILTPVGTVTFVPTAEMWPFSIRITAAGTLTPRRTSMTARVLRATCDVADAAVDDNVITINPIRIVRLIAALPFGIMAGRTSIRLKPKGSTGNPAVTVFAVRKTPCSRAASAAEAAEAHNLSRIGKRPWCELRQRSKQPESSQTGRNLDLRFGSHCSVFLAPVEDHDRRYQTAK